MGRGGFLFYFTALFCKTCSLCVCSQKPVKCKCYVVYFKMLTQEMSCPFSLSPPEEK